MLAFGIITTAYVALLILYRPAPKSLKQTHISFPENAKQIKASLFVGILLLLAYLGITKLTFNQVDPSLFIIFGLNNSPEAAMLWPLQVFTHLFVHADMYHLLSNVTGIGLASAYERRVGSRRYILILTLGALASVPSVLFYNQPIINCGISGGVFALAAAYFTDYKNLTLKEWLHAIGGFILLAIFLSFEGDGGAANEQASLQRVNHIAHILGALTGIVYCRIKPSKVEN